MKNAITSRDITDFLDTEYADFSRYVIENRAVPSVIDGFKPVQRKIVHVARNVWKTTNEKSMRVFQLTGKISNECFYHHGDMSMNKAIVNMVQHFKNNLPLFDEDGQFGSLRSPDAGAPRYIGTKLNSSFRLVYKDFDLMTPKYEEGYEIEPKYFLPIIPMVLVNGGKGIAVAYSTNIMNRNPKDVLSACLSYLKGKKAKTIKPHLNGFKGTFREDPVTKNKWIIEGVYERVNTTSIRVTELPPSMTYEKWEALLEKLVDLKKLRSYDDNSKDGIDYTLRFSREEVEKFTKHPDIFTKMFKLCESDTEVITTIDENGKLKIFDTTADVVSYFVDFRLGYYEKRKQNLISKLVEDMSVLDNKSKFLKAILDERIIINKRSKEDIIKQITSENIDKKDGSFDYLTRMPISSLSKEEWLGIQDKIKEKKAELTLAKKGVPKDEYIKDLEALKNKLK